MDQTIPRGGWWSRNWKWFVPVGCLSLLATCGLCCGGSIWWGARQLSQSRTYQDALARAKADPDVQAALGTPIDTGWNGLNMNAEPAPGGGARIKLRIPLQGPKGAGSLHVTARETAQEIRYDQLDVVVGSQVIHLPGVETRDPPQGPGDEKTPDRKAAPGWVNEDNPGTEDGDTRDHEPDSPEVTVEVDTDRPGGDFRDYEAGAADAAKCAADCAENQECKAYTFVKEAAGKPARCRLKGSVPAKAKSDCCVSGVKK